MAKTLTIASKFAGRCTACSLYFPAGTLVLWARGAGAKHATSAACEAAKAAVVPVAAPVAVHVGEFAGVVALFTKAKEHLKFPKVRLMVGGTKIVLSLNGVRSKTPGFVSIAGEGTYPNRAYYGRVSPDGAFAPFSKGTTPEFMTALTALLTEFGSDPARVAKEHGKLTGNCCFCNKVLGLGEDKRSIHVGYGPVCADHYGLKAEWLHGVAAAEAAALPEAA